MVTWAPRMSWQGRSQAWGERWLRWDAPRQEESVAAPPATATASDPVLAHRRPGH